MRLRIASICCHLSVRGGTLPLAHNFSEITHNNNILRKVLAISSQAYSNDGRRTNIKTTPDWSKLPKNVRLVEVGPRDGLQNEPQKVCV